MSIILSEAIQQSAVVAAFPDGVAYTSISADQVQGIAGCFSTTVRQVEIASLENKVVPERYIRNMRTFSADDQVRLLRARASVVGLGGLGGGVAELLARTGVGHLTLIDGDRFEESNLNRQLMSTVDLLGTFKVEAAAARIRAVNPSVDTTGQPLFLDNHNAAGMLADSDVVVDCLDSLDTRRVLQDACRQLKIPLVSAAVAGFSGQLTAIFPQDNGFDLIYGHREPGQPSRGAEASLGTIPYTVALMSSLECNEAVRILLTGRSNLRNHLMVVDLTDYAFEVFKLA